VASATKITAWSGLDGWSGSVCWSWTRGHGKASAASTSVMTARFRLGDHGRTRKERDPVEFSFHDFDFLCVVVLNSMFPWFNEGRPRHEAFRR
jgi:hypothetical protein